MTFRPGDLVKLVRGRPYAGLKIGEVGVVTDIDLEQGSFSVNECPGCLPAYWEAAQQHRIPRKTFDALVEKARRELEAFEAELFGAEFQEAA